MAVAVPLVGKTERLDIEVSVRAEAYNGYPLYIVAIAKCAWLFINPALGTYIYEAATVTNPLNVPADTAYAADNAYCAVPDIYPLTNKLPPT